MQEKVLCPSTRAERVPEGIWAQRGRCPHSEQNPPNCGIYVGGVTCISKKTRWALEGDACTGIKKRAGVWVLRFTNIKFIKSIKGKNAFCIKKCSYLYFGKWRKISTSNPITLIQPWLAFGCTPFPSLFLLGIVFLARLQVSIPGTAVHGVQLARPA